MKKRQDQAPRHFVLEAGDELLASPTLGYLVLIKTNGEVIDLNQIIMNLGCTEMCMSSTRQLDWSTFGQLASALAASYGLTANTVHVGYPALVAPLNTPNTPNEAIRPSTLAEEFMANPRIPSLEALRR